MEYTQPVQHYLNIFRRRRALILLTSGLLFLLGIVVALAWPPTYSSTATILIEEQEVPPDLVRSTITSYADQQIERIKAQVMSRSHLWPIIEENGLYKDHRARGTSESVLQGFIEDIAIEVLSASVVDRRTGRQTQATIAFTLSYEGSTPQVTQTVANELTTLFLNQNLQDREHQVQETTAFLKQETEKLAQTLSQIEQQIAEFKKRAKGALPELVTLNMQLFNQTDRQLLEIDQEIRSQNERLGFLTTQIATLDPNMPTPGAADRSLTPPIQERLKALRSELTEVSSRFSSEHPDVIRLKAEIHALAQEVDTPLPQEELAQKIKDEQTNLATLLKRYGSDHPDVTRSQAKIASLEEEQAQSTQDSSTQQLELYPNAAYMTLQSQIASTKSTLAQLQNTKSELQRRVQNYGKRLEHTSALEPEYQTLVRDRDNAAKKYHELRSRLQEAQVAEGMERERKGERFSLIDPPSLPEEPIRPNRPVLLALGLILGIVGGIGSGALAENLDGSIRNAHQLQKISKHALLGVIPYVYSEVEITRSKKKPYLMTAGVLVSILTILAIVHVFWLPLDVVWFAVLRKVGVEVG